MLKHDKRRKTQRPYHRMFPSSWRILKKSRNPNRRKPYSTRLQCWVRDRKLERNTIMIETGDMHVS
jgi:hypothetical protein